MRDIITVPTVLAMKLMDELDELRDKLDDINQLLDQLPDPDQPSYDLQRDYRGWLAGLDEELKCH